MVNYTHDTPGRFGADTTGDARLAALAARFGWAVDTGAEWVLAAANGRLELRAGAGRRQRAIRAATAPARRLSRGEPLGRALGRGNGLVVDATAGLGVDALRIASLGRPVLAIERQPVLWALLDDAVSAAGGPVRVLLGDALSLLPTLDPAPAVVYLDPMFPPRRKRSARTRKETEALRALAGEDRDAAALLAVARSVARERVVVKRPHEAPPLAGGAVASHAGKLVRYDVYRPQREA